VLKRTLNDGNRRFLADNIEKSHAELRIKNGELRIDNEMLPSFCFFNS
jgi:hypothetical protein